VNALPDFEVTDWFGGVSSFVNVSRHQLIYSELYLHANHCVFCDRCDIIELADLKRLHSQPISAEIL
jgi:hypothetical protein